MSLGGFLSLWGGEKYSGEPHVFVSADTRQKSSFVNSLGAKRKTPLGELPIMRIENPVIYVSIRPLATVNCLLSTVLCPRRAARSNAQGGGKKVRKKGTFPTIFTQNSALFSNFYAFLRIFTQLSPRACASERSNAQVLPVSAISLPEFDHANRLNSPKFDLCSTLSLPVVSLSNQSKGQPSFQPFITNYAKQTQFPKSQNERKCCYNKGL